MSVRPIQGSTSGSQLPPSLAFDAGHLAPASAPPAQQHSTEARQKLEEESLGTEDFDALEAEVARLAPIGALPDTEEAKRFDYLLLQTELAALQRRPLDPLRKKVQAVAAALQDQPTFPPSRPNCP